MKRLFKIITGRTAFICFFILVQLISVFFLAGKLSECSGCIRAIMSLINFAAVIYIVNKNDDPMFMLSWTAAILLFSPTGWIFYFIFERRKMSFKTRKYDTMQKCGPIPKDDLSGKIFSQIKYICGSSGAEYFRNTKTEFYSCGEIFYQSFINELERAEKCIFLEYFIISPGKMWDRVYSIIRKKSADGVEVKILYDDMCCVMFSRKFRQELLKNGIQTAPFNTMKPIPDVLINYRDHRKIAVIDGVTAFTGGINIADEYINEKEKYGYWKDNAVMLKGKASLKMAEMFAQMWEICSPDKIVTDLSAICCDVYDEDGITLPFGDTPHPSSQTAEKAYLKMINSAERYAYITTPYLIPDTQMITALRLASESGADVRIITPFIPDKWYIQVVTRANYRPLLESGVKIYEYLPGFIHSKMMISDDTSAIIGTANFDYRSFYMLFENGVFMYKTKAAEQMKEDFADTLSHCREITAENYRMIPLRDRIFGALFKIFSPLM